MTSKRQPCVSAYFWYIARRSPANKAASSPPAAPRISRIIFLSSLGSFGKRRIFKRSSYSSLAALDSLSSSLAISSKSGSPLASLIISSASEILWMTCLYSRYAVTVSRVFASSRDNSMKRLVSETTSGSLSNSPNSS